MRRLGPDTVGIGHGASSMGRLRYRALWGAVVLALATPAAAQETPGCGAVCPPPPPPSSSPPPPSMIANQIHSTMQSTTTTAIASQIAALDRTLLDTWLSPNPAAELAPQMFTLLAVLAQIQQADRALQIGQRKAALLLISQAVGQIAANGMAGAATLQQAAISLQNGQTTAAMTLMHGMAAQLNTAINNTQKQINANSANITGLQNQINNLINNQPKNLPSQFAPTDGPGYAQSSAWRDPALANAFADAAPPQPAPMPTKVVRTSPGSPWAFWAEAVYTRFDRTGAAATDGGTGFFSAAVSYRAADRVITGLSLGYEDQRFNTPFNGGNFNGTGTTIAPFASWLVTSNVMLNVAGGVTLLDHSTSDGTGNARYDAKREFVSASLLGTWREGPWRFTPGLNAFYAAENHDGFTDTAGTAVAGAIVRAGRVALGPEIGYSLLAFDGRGIVEPFVLGGLHCDITDQPGIFVANGIVVSDHGCGGTAGGGLKAFSANGLSGAISATYDSIGQSDQHSWTLQARLQKAF